MWLATTDVVDAVDGCLDPDERRRAQRFKLDAARARYVAGHGVLRHVLAARLGRRADVLRFTSTAGGKPVLADGGLHFNLSHSGDLVAVAVAPDRAVGVDVELRRPVTRAEGVALRIMDEDELALYFALPDAGPRLDHLLRVWARTEAVYKAGDPNARVVDLEVPGYAGAVAAPGDDWVPVVREFGD